MLYGFLLTLFIILCFFLILIILVQKSKGSLGIGSMGGTTQMLFGAGGGQDLLQKITWFGGGIFMVGSLILTLMNSSSLQTSRYLVPKTKPLAQQEIPVEVPITESLPTTPEAQ